MLRKKPQTASFSRVGSAESLPTGSLSGPAARWEHRLTHGCKAWPQAWLRATAEVGRVQARDATSTASEACRPPLDPGDPEKTPAGGSETVTNGYESANTASSEICLFARL